MQLSPTKKPPTSKRLRDEDEDDDDDDGDDGDDDEDESNACHSSGCRAPTVVISHGSYFIFFLFSSIFVYLFLLLF